MGARIFCVFVLAKYSDDRIVDFTPVFLPRFPPSIKKGANLISRPSGEKGGGDIHSPETPQTCERKPLYSQFAPESRLWFAVLLPPDIRYQMRGARPANQTPL